MLVRDIIMMENQGPLFLLLILELQVKSPQLTEKILSLMLGDFLKDLTPFKRATNFQSIEIASHSHLLEILCHSIAPLCHEEVLDPSEETDHNDCPQNFCSSIEVFAAKAKVFFLVRTKAFMSLLTKFLNENPMDHNYLNPNLHRPNIFNYQVDSKDELDCTQMAIQGLSFDEIAIPSVTELANAGIQFDLTHGDMSSVAVDAKTVTFDAKTEISFDVNSEVVLRNPLAYEAAIVTGPLVAKRDVELMNGIIDTEKDEKMLREKGVLVNRLRSDNEVAEQWNGMRKSTRVKVLDEVIEEVNKYYNRRWKVKFGGCVRRYVKSSWETLVVVLVILLFIVVGLQAFSTVLFLIGTWAHRRK